MYYLRKKQMRTKEHRGQSLVEFALALPVFLLIVFGIVEFGMLIFSVAVVNGSAREGARYGAAKGVNNQYYNCSGIESAVTGTGNLIGMTAANVNITYDDGAGTTHAFNCPTLATYGGSLIEAGDRVIVEVAYVYNPLMRNILALPVPQMNLGSTVRRLIVKDLVIEGAAGSAAVVIGTVTSTPATACDSVTIDHLDPFDFNAGAKTMDFDIYNASTEIIQLDKIYHEWPSSASQNGALNSITLTGSLSSLIWNWGMGSSPVTIPDVRIWNPASNATERQVAAGTSSNILFQFNKGAETNAAADYLVTLIFTVDPGGAATTCVKTTTYDVD